MKNDTMNLIMDLGIPEQKFQTQDLSIEQKRKGEANRQRLWYPCDNPSLDEIAAEWDRNVERRANELEDGIDGTYDGVLIPYMLRRLSECEQAERVLDVGCGLGFLANKFCEKGYKVEAIDISQKSIQYAEERFPAVKFYQSDVVSFSSTHIDTQYDVCVANMVLHNTPDLNQVTQAINSMLRPGGRLIVSIPHPRFWYRKRPIAKYIENSYLSEQFFKVAFKIRNGQTHPSPITYFHRWQNRYRDILTRSGFSIENSDGERNSRESCPPDLLLMICRKRFN
jgi:2-polyprenyl-3-methyl-5-hydroxy-6-metoxy-1,4-benzoquinol methylase